MLMQFRKCFDRVKPLQLKDNPENASIVDLTFRITTCRSLLAIAFRT